MDIILKKDEKPDVDSILDFLRSISIEEQKEFETFIHGIRFAMKLLKKAS